MSRRTLFVVSSLLVFALLVPAAKLLRPYLPGATADLNVVYQRVEPQLQAHLNLRGMALGQPTFIRIFKEERVLEVWMRADATYRMFKTYDICAYSGDLGPKLQEGDRQSPEGFYAVAASAMNPNSSYHLSFNLGFPNAFDRAHDRTGSFLMVHGDCVSIGCYAMTDPGIEEIYLIVDAAHKAGQAAVPVHAFPFRMTSDRLDTARDSEWYAYWMGLKPGYDLFEVDLVPPEVSVSDGAYVFRSGAEG